ncbi:hypothetical protein B0H14DRAFT_2560516 [Mycena olivaceomarginata]|nr:hypothetical protein B0H14DRAFT_2560516 [Mycena olivaceomarginata]
MSRAALVGFQVNTAIKAEQLAEGWRVELRKWVSDAQAAEQDEATDKEDEPIPAKVPKVKWTKTTFAVLFGDVVKKPVVKLAKADLAREAALMKALAEAEEDARLDDGAMEGSGDEYGP